MDIWNDVISIVVSNGVFAILFVWLFLYMLKDSKTREEKYQQTIETLTTHLQTLEDVREDLTEIKDMLKSRNVVQKQKTQAIKTSTPKTQTSNANVLKTDALKPQAARTSEEGK